MSDSNKKNPDNQYQDLKNEITKEAVEKVFRENPKDWRSKLSEIGLTFYEDETCDLEAIEEKNAAPETVEQEYLVAYFEGHVKLNQKVLDTFQMEKNSPIPNYPLIRKYFKQGNSNLKQLLLFGLEQDPTNDDFLSDLGFFHEFSPVLGELIKLYINACKLEKDIPKFEALVKDFYYCTEPDGYDALYALKEIFPTGTGKGTIIDRISVEVESSSSEAIEF